MPGIGGQADRHGIPFNSFFASDATPVELIKAGIYMTIAVPFKGGAWREPSFALMAKDIDAPPGPGKAQEVNLKDKSKGHQASCTRTSGCDYLPSMLPSEESAAEPSFTLKAKHGSNGSSSSNEGQLSYITTTGTDGRWPKNPWGGLISGAVPFTDKAVVLSALHVAASDGWRFKTA
eukprot:2007226-Prymnesium_polylepis.1